jgi:hypothetical protein
MTETQAGIAALGWEIRLSEEDRELWFEVEPWALPDAHGLCEEGWLDRRIAEEVEWRLSDRGLFSLRMDALRGAVSMN